MTNRKHLLSTVALVLLLAMSMSLLCSCSGADPLVGSWKHSGAVSLEKSGVTFNADGTCKWVNMSLFVGGGDEMTCPYTTTGNKLMFTDMYNETQTFTYRIEGNHLYLTTVDGVFTIGFVRK